MKFFRLGFLFCFCFANYSAQAVGTETGTGTKAKTETETETKAEAEMEMASNEVGDAIKKTAETAATEAKGMAIEAHTFGGKFLQALINVMIAASPGKTRVYLPAPSTDPNSGLTVGLLPVFLFLDKKEVVQQIFAPSITHNKIFGVTTTLRHYWYPHLGAQLFTFASYATKSNYRFTLRYEDPHFFCDWAYFKFDATATEEGSYRFFGFGGNSKTDDQTNYALRDRFLLLTTGLNLNEHYKILLTHRFRHADTVDGPIDSLPQISRFSPPPKGVNDPKDIVAQRLTFQYDTRDLAMAPLRGNLFSVFAEKAGHLGGQENFQRYGSDWRGYVPVHNNRFVTAWKMLLESTNNADIPFYEQSLLGGKDSLRGFGDARFVGKAKATLSVEERILFYHLNAFNVDVNFEVAPFYEGGTVADTVGQIGLESWHHVGGVGFRSIVRPNVVGAIEVGFSEDGVALFVGIDYPF